MPSSCPILGWAGAGETSMCFWLGLGGIGVAHFSDLKSKRNRSGQGTQACQIQGHPTKVCHGMPKVFGPFWTHLFKRNWRRSKDALEVLYSAAMPCTCILHSCVTIPKTTHRAGFNTPEGCRRAAHAHGQFCPAFMRPLVIQACTNQAIWVVGAFGGLYFFFAGPFTPENLGGG